MPRNFALGARFEAFIDDEVRSGRFTDANDVVREGLRLLAQRDVDLEHADELRKLVVEARLESRLVEADTVFDRLEAKFAEAVDGRSH